jgi:hypothetical protein
VDSLSKILRFALVAAVTGSCLCAVPTFGEVGYPRPKGAGPTRGSLVPVFERCETDGGRKADSVHGAPLAYPSCLNPELVSGTVTIGTPDANGKASNSIGYFTYSVMTGKPSTPEDEADVKIDVKITDVRLQNGLDDYPGELELELDSRITDASSGPGFDLPATLETFFYYATIPCTPTDDTSIGATCALHTTMDTLIPDTIKEGKRTIWSGSDHTHIFDGGDDWLASTKDDNLAFMTWGVYVP